MITSFVYNPQRDASRAIKGFFYQVELTVIRWLGLERGTVLYCECGEDIDHVKQLLDADPNSQVRLLEQIKARDRITLRSPEVLTALARFREAIVNNPSLRILYRFSTTASSGKEQGVKFPCNLTGIGAWSAVREGTLIQQEVQEFVDSFKTLVTQALCPQDLQESVFAQLQEYVASTHSQVLIDKFIRRFEWATGLPDPSQLRTKIQFLLLNQSRAHVQEEAQLLTDVLIVHVFHLLTQKGEKRLTVEELEHLLHERSITELDRRLLTRLASFIEQAEAYFSRFSSQIESVSRGVATLQGVPEQLSQLTQHVSGIETQFLPLQLPPPDEPPLPPLGFSKRVELVRTLLTKLSEVTWLNITGATDMGKTFAARLVAEEQGLARTAWISLRGEHANEGLPHRLDLHLLRIASIPDCPDLVQAYVIGALPFSQLARKVALRLGTEALLVIDEVPDLLKVPLLAEKLTQLTVALQESGGKLLTTAQRNVPPSIAERLGSAIAEKQIPSMSQQDISEMLTTAGAPSAFHDPSYLNLIHAATRGHPYLISATILFLRRNTWAVDQNQLFSILTGDPTGEVRAEARHKVLQLLPNNNVRELLYRLSLIGAPFDIALVRAVAALPPPVSRSAELLPELTGPWVYQLAADRFEVSPLLSDAGQVTLDPKFQRDVHFAVASHHLQKRSIDQEQAFQIIVHLSAAHSWYMLTPFLLQLTSQLGEKPHAEAFEFITFFFTISWPDDMPLDLRISFRAAQVRVLTLLGRDAKTFVTDLDTMIQQANAFTLPAAFGALLLIGPLNPAASPSMVARRALQACRLSTRLPAEMQQVPFEVPLESFVWMGLTRIQTQDDIRGILALFTDMTEKERRGVFSDDVLSEAPQIFVDKCWTLELAKAKEERDWGGVLLLLAEVTQIAQLPGGEPLRAPIARAKAIVLADGMERPQDALAILEEALPAANNNEQFLLHYTAGCVLLDHSTPESALEHYQKALAESLSANSFLYFDALRRAAEAAGRIGRWQATRDFAIMSLKLFREDDLVYERLEMMGELAWAHWSLGDRARAWGAMSGLVRGLAQKQDLEDNRFREVFRKTGHALGWMVSMAQSGKPPIHTVEGQPYTEPFPGFFSRSRPQLADMPLTPLFHVLFGQLGMFADGCRLYEHAWRTLNQAKHLAQPQGLSFFQHIIGLELAELAMRKEDYKEALRLAISAVRALPATQRLREVGVDLLTAQISLKDIWDGLSEERRQETEHGLYWIVIGPAIMRLLAKDAPTEAYATVIAEITTIFQQSEHDLVEPQYWLHMLRELRIAFSPLATRETIREQIRGLPESELHLRLLLYLAFSRTPNATLSEICGAQAATFDLLLRTLPVSKLMAENVAIYLLRYWTEVAETQAFALRNPQALRRGLKSLQQPIFSNVATLLLLAADATEVRLDDSLRQSLINSTGSSFA